MDKQLLRSPPRRNINQQRSKSFKPLTNKKSNYVGIYILFFVVIIGIGIGIYFEIKKAKEEEARKDREAREDREATNDDDEKPNTEKEVYSVMKNQCLKF